MKKILCPGEALIDFVSLERTNDLKKCNTFTKKVGGAALNVCGAMTKLGIEADFIGAVGMDPFGEFIIDYLVENNLNTNLIDRVEKNTTLAFVTLDDAGERDFVFNRGADEFLKINDKNVLADYDAFHFGSATAFLGGSLEHSYNTTLEYAINNDKFISFDPNYREDLFKDNKTDFIKKALQYIKVSNLIKLSEQELYLITGINDINKACEHLSNITTGYLVITLGNKGSLLYYDHKSHMIPSIEVQALDSTGAGDAFIGALVAKTVSRERITIQTLKDDIFISNIVGALTTTKYGALSSIPTAKEIEKYL